MTRNGDWILTHGGRQFWPLDPWPEDVNIDDIAHALAHQCRFSGHTARFYSVAEHSIHVSVLCAHEGPLAALCGLLHDAAEAYLVDLPRPLKHHSLIGTLYQDSERELVAAIAAAFKLPPETPPVVDRADKAMLWYESQQLLPPHECWEKYRAATSGMLRPHIRCLTPNEAKWCFLRRYKNLLAEMERGNGESAGLR